MKFFTFIIFIGLSFLNPNLQGLENTKVTPKEALKRLLDGNARYVSDKLELCTQIHAGREALLTNQKPFATILGCSDSRVSPEIIFDQGIGDLFVVRVAGNVVGPIGLDSLDYSTIYLGSSLILVLGHEGCGAVQAVLDGKSKSIEAVASKIEPSIASVKGKPGNSLENAVKANVIAIVKELKNSPEIGELVKQGRLEVVGGYYNLKNGVVDILTQP